jgi:hypothetical protein
MNVPIVLSRPAASTGSVTDVLPLVAEPVEARVKKNLNFKKNRLLEAASGGICALFPPSFPCFCLYLYALEIDI